MRNFYTIILFSLITLSFTRCDKKSHSFTSHFTKADSLTEYYLTLQDTLLQHWNLMINDDNQKIKAMQSLLHELMVTDTEENQTLTNLEERLEQLVRMRYTQKSMVNKHVVDEYDYASGALISELISAAESRREYAYNTTLRKLAEAILAADQRAVNFRFEYDSIVTVFNNFLERNKDHLEEADHHLSLEKKPAFQMISAE